MGACVVGSAVVGASVVVGGLVVGAAVVSPVVFRVVTGVVGFAVVEGFFVLGGGGVDGSLVVVGALVVETAVGGPVVCRSVDLPGVVSLPEEVVSSLVAVVVLATSVGFSVFWPPGEVNRSSLI